MQLPFSKKVCARMRATAAVRRHGVALRIQQRITALTSCSLTAARSRDRVVSLQTTSLTVLDKLTVRDMLALR